MYGTSTDNISNDSQSDQTITVCNQSRTSVTANQSDHVYSSKRQKIDVTASAMQLLLGDEYSTHRSADSNSYEVDLYWTEPNVGLDVDPLSWWKAHSEQYPNLCELAMKYLSVPATSVPAERVFSTAGLVVNRLRARLTSEHVDMLVFLRKNYHNYDSYEGQSDEEEEN